MSAPSDACPMSERAKEVTEMLSRIWTRRLVTAALVIGALAAAMPALSFAANVGGGP